MYVSKQIREPKVDGSGEPLGERLLACRSAFLGFLIKRLGSRTEAEDVLQDFCVRVLSKTTQLRDADRMDAWLYAVLRSTLNDHYRKSGRRRRLKDAVALEMTTAEGSENGPESKQKVCHCVTGLVSELRPSDAALIQRIDLDGENRSFVASSLHVQPGTLNVRLHRARVALRDKVLDHCGCCCQNGFDDCSCPPKGCSSSNKDSHCGERRVEESHIRAM